MSKKKILVVTGTRAEYGLLKSSIDGIMTSEKLKLRLLVTGMHTLKKFGLTINEIKKDKVPINCIVKVGENDDMLTALSKEIVGIKKYCKKDKPDLILVLGDRDEPFAAAIVGGHLGIPIGHIHGGDVTTAIVDGAIRHSITKFAHLHFAACKTSYNRIIQLQENPENIFLVGAPGFDGIKNMNLLDKDKLAKKFKIDPQKKWLLFIMHPAPFERISFEKQIKNPLQAIAKFKTFAKIIIYPNSDTGNNIFIKEINKYKNNNSFYLFKSLPRNVYLSFLKYVDFLIGNSSSGIVESGYFRLPAINIGNREKNRERGNNVIDVDYQVNNIIKTINISLGTAFKNKCKKAKNPYGDGTAGKKIVKVLENIDYKNLFFKKSYYG